MVLEYFGEMETDKYIREKFFPDFSVKETMVEVGAATPEFLSLSNHFRLNGWRCICVDPNPKYAEMHRQRGNEIYQYACSFEDKDDQDFEIVHKGDNYEGNQITDHSFSSLKVKDAYKRTEPNYERNKVIKTKVAVRKLDTILAPLNISSLAFVSIDVEGWELEVMRGFDIKRYKPKVVLLENYLHLPEYAQYMKDVGYFLCARIQWNYIFRPATRPS